MYNVCVFCLALTAVHSTAQAASGANIAGSQPEHLTHNCVYNPEELPTYGHLPAQTKATLAVEVPWYEWIPAVMPFDRPTILPMTLTAQITGGASSARLTVSGGGGTITLLDNGVFPDSTAGDLIFSGSVPVQTVLDRNTPARINKPVIGQLQALDSTGTATGPLLNIVLGVMPAEARSIPVTTVSSTVRTTPWLINIRDDAFASDLNYQRVTQTAYTLLPDRFQFVHIVYGPKQYIQNRFHGVIRNNVQGIGKPIIDTGASWGSPSALIGFTVFPNLSFYDMQGPGVLHETGHQWINSLGGVFADPRGGSHWPISTLANNAMGFSLAGGAGGNLSCSLSSNGSTLSTQAAASSSYYNSWELYLMGLTATVPSAFVVTDQTAALSLLNTPNWCNGSTYNLATTSITQSTLTTLVGNRVPAFANSPKYFRVMTLVASSGRTLGNDELAYISWMTARAQDPGVRGWSEGLGAGTGPTFFDATAGRGKLDFRLDGQFQSGFEGD